MSRDWCLKAAAESCPQIFKALCQLWETGPHQLWVETSAGHWECKHVNDGLWQGFCEASAVFSLGLRRALLNAVLRCRHLGIEVDVLSYIDDTLLQLSPSQLPRAWPIVIEELQRARLNVNISKCSAFVPAASEIDTNITTIMPQRLDGLPLLGSAVQGEFEHFLGPLALALQPTQKRVIKAIALAAVLREMAQCNLACPKLQVSWVMLRSVVAHALDFDARIHSPAVLQPFAEQLKQAVLQTAGVILGRSCDSLDECAREALTLPIGEGGGGLQDIVACSPAAFLAARLQVWPMTVQRCVGLGWRQEAVTSFFCIEAAKEAQEALQVQGVFLNSQGSPSEMPASTVLDFYSLPAPASGRFAEIMRHVHEARKRLMLGALCPVERSRVRSCGGPVAGLFLTAIPESPSCPEFRRALLMRLGMAQCVEGTPCQHLAASLDAKCGHILLADARHALCCKYGKGIMRLHSFVADYVAKCCSIAGLHARREVVVPEWAQSRVQQDGSRKVVEAIMDVEATGFGDISVLHIDATVRYPLAQRYLQVADGHSSSDIDGHATKVADKDKQERYPPRNGLRVTTAAVETFGRLGDAFLDLLQNLNMLAHQRDTLRGLPPKNHLHTWHVELSCDVARAASIAIEDAVAGGEGTAVAVLTWAFVL